MVDRLAYGQFLAEIQQRFGVAFTVADTGGGCLLFQARLETGDWLVISDWDSGLTPLPRRRQLEAQGTTVGWAVNVCADDGEDWPQTATILAGVSHETATADELPALIELALNSLTDNAHHEIRKATGHSVLHGVIEL